ncbi:helix-turn-helix transcriptional regulator [Hymenobacter sp. H14-R3]|uniref:helix-turn-helix domain-containing protein n=1 Tax=Hymenobacter sp. H14-R3 TaxID=3046308 RepID=UPI0024B9824D|nr:helix-turn-helix transcriptional regulator [Hymenobacter sp. H14-R3]MDJ0366547.1 helix-turn-helix transcriptional regulator [Hymenobacter sp. H14-R3]
MKSATNQSLEQFQRGCRPEGELPATAALAASPFSVLAFDAVNQATDESAMLYQRRDFYKISLYTGGATQIQYAGRTFLVDRPALMFYNPLLPFACQTLAPLTGYCCLFSNDFLYGADRTASLQESPLFRLGADPLFYLTAEQTAHLTQLFRQMQAEAASDYRHKYEVVRTHIQLVVHEALRLRPEPTPAQLPTAASRLAADFLRLLEEQFPVASLAAAAPLHTAQAFADALHVHVNHLNRAVRDTTGKTTSTHLAERIAHEAQTLLRHTSQSTADIADSLGFTEASYFNSFFRKHAGLSPKSFRQQQQSV